MQRPLRDVLIDSSVYREDGRFIHTRCFTRDVTELKRAEAARAQLAAIVTSSHDAIVSKNLDGIVLTWNLKVCILVVAESLSP